MILVTGISGFIGQHLIKKVAADYGVNNIVLLTSKPISGFKCLDHKNYTFTKNIWQDNHISNIETVIHAGAFTPKSGVEANNIMGCNSNINNTAHLILQLPDEVKTFIFLSTIDVYGVSLDKLDENSLTAPNSLYGYSKLYCEKMLEAWALQNKKRLQILRIGHIYGPGEDAYKKIIPETIKTLLKGDSPVIYSKGHEKRAFLYIQDCCNYIVKSINLLEYMGPINVVSGESVPINLIVRKIVKISSLKKEPIILNRDILAKDVVFNNSKLLEILGNTSISLDEGLKKEWDYFNGLYGPTPLL